MVRELAPFSAITALKLDWRVCGERPRCSETSEAASGAEARVFAVRYIAFFFGDTLRLRGGAVLAVDAEGAGTSFCLLSWRAALVSTPSEVGEALVVSTACIGIAIAAVEIAGKRIVWLWMAATVARGDATEVDMPSGTRGDICEGVCAGCMKGSVGSDSLPICMTLLSAGWITHMAKHATDLTLLATILETL